MSSFFLLFLFQFITKGVGQTCSIIEDLLMSGKGQPYDEAYASLSPPLCGSGTTGLEYYKGNYEVLTSYAGEVNMTRECGEGGAMNLFDRSSMSTWLVRASDRPWVMFKTEYVNPLAVAIWNYGDGLSDVYISQLETSISPRGPWIHVATVHSAPYFDAGRPQIHTLGRTSISPWRRYWKWTIISSWDSTKLTRPREFLFFSFPHAKPYEFNSHSPAPFYTHNRDGIFSHQPGQTPPATSDYSPFALVFGIQYEAWQRGMVHLAGVQFETTSLENGVRRAVVRRYENGGDNNHNNNRSVLCEFHAEEAVKNGICAIPQPSNQTPCLNFVFIASNNLLPPCPRQQRSHPIPSNINLKALTILLCPTTIHCDKEVSQVSVVIPPSVRVGGVGEEMLIDVIDVDPRLMCHYTVIASTPMLF